MEGTSPRGSSGCRGLARSRARGAPQASPHAWRPVADSPI